MNIEVKIKTAEAILKKEFAKIIYNFNLIKSEKKSLNYINFGYRQKNLRVSYDCSDNILTFLELNENDIVNKEFSFNLRALMFPEINAMSIDGYLFLLENAENIAEMFADAYNEILSNKQEKLDKIINLKKKIR